MTTTYKKIDVEELLTTLPLKTKVDLLAGKDFWNFESSPKHGIPPVRVSDGPNGVRGSRFFNGTPANCFPSSTGTGASFDVELVERIGKALGNECRAKGAHVLLGPTCNMQRSPLGGRGFESFGEDPALSGLITAAYINGLQSQGVAACVKHYVANDQEFERFSIDSVVSQRALREIYLEPFRLAVKHSSPWSFMTAYNRVNGTHVSENTQLLDDILRKEWGFDGLVMSDWTGVYSTSQSIKAGLDVEMPGPTTMRGTAVMRQLAAGKIFVEDIDERVRNILNLANRAIESGIPFDAEETAVDTPETRALLRESAASAIVLLKNEKQLLPISGKPKKIAVIGSNAKIAVPSGGGSASLAGTYTISPLDGITEAAKEIGAEVSFATGASAFRYLPLLDPFMKNAKVEFFIDAPTSDYFNDASFDKKADWEEATKSSLAFMIDGVPYEKLGDSPRCRFTAELTSDFTGTWDVSIGSLGQATLLVDGKVVVENVESRKGGELFFGMGSEERRAQVQLEKGKTYLFEIRHWTDPSKIVPGPFATMDKAAGFRVGAYPSQTVEAAREEAVALAKTADVAVLVVGTNVDWESEGFDRKNIDLPGATDDLVRAVLAINPNTVVVTQSGTPVAMPWIKDAPTVVQAFFGGNELGNGLADILFGKVNPSGKLPLTFPARLEDTPSYHSFGITSDTPGKVVYGEGIFMGYRHFDRSNIAPLFPFGYGLSYTSFAFSDLKVSSASAEGDFTVSFTITNTGKTAGKQVGQVYVSPPTEGRITSPVKELVAFKKVALKAGEKKEVTVKVSKEAFSYYDEHYESWVATAGAFKVLVGGSSDALDLEGEVKLEKTFKWKGL